MPLLLQLTSFELKKTDLLFTLYNNIPELESFDFLPLKFVDSVPVQVTSDWSIHATCSMNWNKF